MSSLSAGKIGDNVPPGEGDMTFILMAAFSIFGVTSERGKAGEREGEHLFPRRAHDGSL